MLIHITNSLVQYLFRIQHVVANLAVKQHLDAGMAYLLNAVGPLNIIMTVKRDVFHQVSK